MKHLYCIALLLFNAAWINIHAQCTPAANDNCSNAIALTVNGAPLSGTTCGGFESGEKADCSGATTTQSVWYSFVATSNNLAVLISSTGACFLSSAVWDGCPNSASCHSISCQSSAGGPTNTSHHLPSLTVGATYYVQILYAPSGTCGTEGSFNVSVTTTIPATVTNGAPISTCQAPSGSGCVFNYSPSIAYVQNNCPGYTNPTRANSSNEVAKMCFTFTARYSHRINMAGVVNYPAFSCGSGIITWLNWELFDMACNSLSCGSLSNFNTSGLMCGTQYKLCYTYEIPSGCSHNRNHPYVMAIPVPLNTWTSQNPNSSTASICIGDSITLFGNSPGYMNYSWTPSNTLSSSQGGSVLAFPTTTTTYTVSLVDSGGCAQTKTVTVNVMPRPTPTINPANPNLDCTNPTTTLTATGGGTYVWSNGTNGASTSVSAPGVYTVTVTGANTCTASASATVTQSVSVPTPVITPANGQLTCSVTSIDLSASGGVTYQWSTGSTATGIMVTSPGSYTVTVFDNIGCSASTSVSVSQDVAPPPASVTPSVSTLTCTNTSATLTAQGGINYQWNTGGTDSVLTVSSPGSYTVTVTNAANGCTAAATASVNQNITPPNVSIAPPSTITCANPSVTLSASSTSGNVSYDWGAGNTGSTYSVSSAGSYTVTATDTLNGCISTATVNVNQVQSIVTSLSVTQVSCSGANNGAITLQVSGGQSPYSFQWSNQSSQQNLSSLAAGTYTVTITDNAGCTVSASETVTEPSAVTVTETHADISCFGSNDGSINVSVSGGVSPYQYGWNDGGSGANRVALASGSYTVTVTDAAQCTSTITVTLAQPSELLFTSTIIHPTCPDNDADGSVSIEVTGGTPPYTYSWSNGSDMPDIRALAPGGYTVTVTDANQCVRSGNMQLTYQYQFTVSITPSVANIEPGQTVLLNYNLGGSFGSISSNMWSPASSLSCEDCSSPLAAPDETTTYRVEVTNQAGCKASDEMTVYVNPASNIFVPNVFTPNTDGFNDFFELYGNREGIAFLEIQLFNRWGEIIYQSNDHYFRWDGTYKGQPVSPQVLTWKLRLGFVDGHVEPERHGSVSVLK